MPKIDFHTHVSDKLSYACRLVRKVYLMNQSMVVVAEAPLLRAFDERLWVFSALEFIPHCLLDNKLSSVTPIVLTSHLDFDLDAVSPYPYPILLNLNANATVPPHFSRFERLLEVISSDVNDLAAARERYRFYREQGCALSSYRQGH